MAIQIPDIYEAGIDYLTVCGELRTKNRKLRKWAKDNEEEFFFFNFKKNNKTTYCRLGIDDYPEYIHIHVDFAKEGIFAKGGQPKPTGVDFEELLLPIVGLELDVDIVGDFDVSVARLPVIITMTRKIAAEQDNVKMKLVGGSIAVEGAPITNISWTFKENKKTANVRMRGRTKLSFSETYFMDACQFLTSFAETFFERTGTGA